MANTPPPNPPIPTADDLEKLLKYHLESRDISRDITAFTKDILKHTELNASTQIAILKTHRDISKSINEQSDNVSRVLDGDKKTKDILKDIAKNKLLLQRMDKEQMPLQEQLNKLIDERSSSGNFSETYRSLTIEIEQRKTLIKAIEAQKEELRETNNLNEQAKKISEQADTAGKGFGWLSTFTSNIPGLRGLSESFTKAEGAARAHNLANNGKGGMGAGLKSLSGSLGSFMKGPIWITALVAAIKFIVDAMFAADKRVTDIAKNFSTSKEAAVATYQALIESKTVLLSQLSSTKNIVEAFNELANLSDFVGQASFNQIDTQIKLTKEIGIQADEAVKLQQLFVLNNNESDEGLDIVYDQIAAFANQNKIMADGRKVIADVNKLSGLIKLNFNGSSAELVKTYLNAAKLGLTLDQISKTGATLLDFESSISSQIEAELLTGKQIYLEKARLYALNHDIAGLTEEINKQGITATKFTEMNVLQQESIAKTLGMSASELGDSLVKQELINKVGGQTLKNKREYVNLLRSEGKESEAILLEEQLAGLEKGIMQGKDIQAAQASLDAQTKFNNALEMAKELFSDMFNVDQIDKIANSIQSIMASLNSGQTLISMMMFGPKLSYDKSHIGDKYKTDKKPGQETTPSGYEIAPIGPKYASGGIINKPVYNATIGEKGPEAVIPINQLLDKFNKLDETNRLLSQMLSKETNLYVDYNKFATAGGKSTYLMDS